MRVYPYISVTVRAYADQGFLGSMDRRYHRGNSFAVFGFNLVRRLIPCIPPEKLDDEHAYWRSFYETKVKQVMETQKPRDFHNTRPAPWDLVDAAFHARKKNPKAVRDAFERLAKEFPRSETILWGGDQWTGPRIPMLLKAAGDPDWETWQPAFPDPGATAAVKLGVITGFLRDLTGPPLFSWELDRACPLPVTQLSVPTSVRMTGRKPESGFADVEALFVAGNAIWLVTPASSVGHERTSNRLFVAEMTPARDGQIILDPVEVSWPQPPGSAEQMSHSGPPIFTAFHALEGTSTAWLGTRSHGLARFDKSEGRWISRWYGQADGFPTESITHIANCRSDAKRLLLLIGSSTEKSPNPVRRVNRCTWVWVLDPETDEVKLLWDDRELDRPVFAPAVTTKDRRTFLLSLLGRENYDVGIDQIVSFGPTGLMTRSHDLVVDETRQLRLLQIGWNAEPAGTFNRLELLSPHTIEPLPNSPGRSGGRYSVFPQPQTKDLFGRIWWREFVHEVTLPGRWPAAYVEFALGREQHLWLGFTNRSHTATSGWLVAYRPAPADAVDWTSQDQWVGPFQLPENGVITRLTRHESDKLLLTTTRGMYIVDCRQAIEQAIESGATRSTQQWRAEYDQRLAASGWRNILIEHLAANRWEQALQILDAQRNQPISGELSKDPTQTHVTLWHAHLLARKGDLDGAIRLYDQAASMAIEREDEPAEVFARMNQIMVLYQAERFREMLDLTEAVHQRFPQTVPESEASSLNQLLRDARTKLAAAKPVP